MYKGKFVTIEGPEGAGKTTILSMLARGLEEAGHTVVVTREPGGIPIAEQIRGVILSRENTGMDPRTEALLYAAARRQHLVEKVLPHLAKGHIVLCDRFIDSSLAYQGYARGLGVAEVYGINQFAIEGMMPNLTLYFDIDPREGLARISRNHIREINRLDLEGLQFHERVREGYLSLLEMYKERMVKVNASQSIESVYHDAYEQILAILDKE